jgi:NAD-dependent deacetylase
MFVVGTSAVVYPAGGLPIMTKRSGGLIVEVNVEPTDLTSFADLSIFGPAGSALPAIWNAITNPKGL